MQTNSKNVTGVIVGSLNMDLVAVGESIPRPGETLPGSDFMTIPGGKGGNQAVACANLGADVKMVARVGNDSFGSDLKTALRSFNVDDSYVFVDEDEFLKGVDKGLVDTFLQVKDKFSNWDDVKDGFLQILEIYSTNIQRHVPNFGQDELRMYYLFHQKKDRLVS